MNYGKEIILYQEIKSTLKSMMQIDRDIIEEINGGQVEGLVVRGRTKNREFDSIISKYRFKFIYRILECNYCHKMGHIKANYFKLKID